MSACFHCMMPLLSDGDRPTKYGEDRDGNRICYACCAWLDVIAMMRGEAVALYLDTSDNASRNATVTNWPGSLRMSVTRAKGGRHNMAGERTTVYFDGPCGSHWSGVEYHGIASGNLLRQVRRLAE